MIVDSDENISVTQYDKQGYILSTILIIFSLLTIYASISALVSGTIGAILCLMTFVSLKYYQWPFALVLRMVLLAVPGLITGISVLLYGSDAVIMFHVSQYQTYEMASRILLLTALALSSSAACWYLALAKPMRTNFKLPEGLPGVRYAVYALFSVIAGTLTARGLGPYVWKASYGTEQGEMFLNLGVMPAISAIGVLGMYCLLLEKKVSKKYWWLFGLISIYVLVHCMFLRGMRLEVFAVWLAMYAGYLLIKKAQLRPLRLTLFLGLAYLGSQIWGVLRSLSDNEIGASEALISAYQVAQDSDLGIYSLLGTLADIAATFFNTVGLCTDGVIGPILGQSYLEFIPRTLPEIIYPNRPGDLAWIFQEHALTSGGGFFELAEAYLNFGTIGCIIVPGLITYVIARLYRAARDQRLFLNTFLYLLMVALLLRGIWYQTFSFYKTTVTWLIMEVIVWVTICIFSEFLSLKRIFRA